MRAGIATAGWLVVTFLLCSARPATASRMPEPPLNPRTYASPSGQYQLFVDPTEFLGRGPGTYRVTRGGGEVWSATLPYTLREAAVADDGTVAGFGYTHGVEGFAPEGAARRDRDDKGDFVVAILAPDGRPRREHRVARAPSRFLHADPTPLARGMFLDPDNDRLVVRVNDADVNARDEEWLAFRLSTGEPLPSLWPKRVVGDGATQSLDARAVPGTGLTLAHWWLYDGKSAGARFTLLDSEGQLIWSLDRAGDYDLDRQRDPDRHGIVSVGPGGRFALRFVREAQRVNFIVRRHDGDWHIAEVSREPYVDPEEAPATPPAVARVELRHLGTVSLGDAAPATQPVRGDIRAFDVDARGRIGFIRMDRDGANTIVFVTADGALLHEVRVEGLGGDDAPKTALAPLTGDRWLATASGTRADAPVRAWWIDAARGTAHPLAEKLDAPPVVDAAGTADGGFVALTRLHHRNAIDDALLRFDPSGRRLWKLDESREAGNLLVAPRDVAVTRGHRDDGGGQIALLDNLGRSVHFLSPDGELLRTLDLTSLGGAIKPNYPADLSPDADGGLIVHDFGGAAPVWRVARDGKLARSFRPRFPDGRAFEIRAGGVRAGPDGALWASDGERLLRLNADDGAVERVLGAAPAADALTEVSAATSDADGRLYAVGRGGIVHVFDRAGRRLFVCTPDPGDFGADARPGLVTVDGDGNVYVAAGDAGAGDPAYVQFDRTGRRVGVRRVTGDPVNAAWHFRPGSNQRWARGYRDVRLLDADETLVRTIARRADNTWLGVVDDIAVAPDGGLAVTTTSAAPPHAVTFYTPAGDATRTVPLPTGYVFALAYDGTRAFAASADGLFVVRADTGETCTFTPEGHLPNRTVWLPILSPDPGEIWLIAQGSNRLERYALP